MSGSRCARPASRLNRRASVSYSGTPAFFNVIGEMREPKFYNRSLYICQTIVTATYLTIGIVVYYYCGQYLANPALGSAGRFRVRLSRKVSLTFFTHRCHGQEDRLRNRSPGYVGQTWP